MPFIDSLDIANRAIDHLGATRIESPTEESVNNSKIAPIYDKVRRAELRRNTWRYSIRKCLLRPIDTTTYLLVPAQYNAGIQYLPGAIVADENNQLWLSNQANNVGNQPGLSDTWDSYFGQMTVDVYDSTGDTAYFAGDLVYIPASNSSYTIYMSLISGNTEAPDTADAWDATVTYQQDQTVTYDSLQWRSLIALNLNNTPSEGPANWAATQTYNASDYVTAEDGYIYQSVGGSNLNINPISDDGTYWTNTNAPNAWAAEPIIPASSTAWTPIYAALRSLNILYPLGAGPLSQAFTRNIYRLPAGYLRQVVDDPKQGINSFLGAPCGRQQDDWEFEGDYILTQQSTPLILRFVADIQTVSKMDDMFCEGLAARIGMEGCESITGSTTKFAKCEKEYNKIMGEARIVNAIEIGPIEPDEDPYITCRI